MGQDAKTGNARCSTVGDDAAVVRFKEIIGERKKGESHG